jgi:GTPase SAR1 family protein
MNSSKGSSSSAGDRLKLDFIVIGNQNAGKTSLIKSFALGDGNDYVI